MLQITFSVANGATVSDAPVVPAGHRLVGLDLPDLTNTTVTITLSTDGSTFRSTFDSAGVASGVVGGAANTGDRFVAVPESLSLMTEGRAVKLTVAAQGAARTIIGLCTRAEGG